MTDPRSLAHHAAYVFIGERIYVEREEFYVMGTGNGDGRDIISR